MMYWYLENVPNVKMFSLLALDKDPMWTDLGQTINGYMTNLSNNVIKRDWPQPEMPEPPDKPEPPIPGVKPKIVILKLAQEHQENVWVNAGAYAYKNYKRTITASLDDMLTMLFGGNIESYAIVVDPEQESQKEAIAALELHGFKYEILYDEDPGPSPRDDLFKYRPCDTDRVTQVFGANPKYYLPYGLPGHEGIDFGVGLNLPFYAVQDGEVVWASDKTGSGTVSNYGWHVYLKHNVNGTEFHTVYAHAKPNLPVMVGENVKAGEIVGFSGNTGISSGPHIHFGLLWVTDTGNGYPMWRFGQCIDPWPFLDGKDAPPSSIPDTIDLLNYIRGDGRLYEVINANGGSERFQTQIPNDGEFRQTKNANAEQLFFSSNSIYRGWDTSPSADRFYQLQNPKGSNMAKWLKRHMSIGETFATSLYVQFFNNDCSLSAPNSGHVTESRKLIKKFVTWTSRAGITLSNVVQIEWSGGETYFYAKGYGLVGWERTHQDPYTPAWSAISEIHAPGQRPDNEVILPGCLS